MASTKYKLGDLLRLRDERNSDSHYTLADVRGISIQKVFKLGNFRNICLLFFGR